MMIIILKGMNQMELLLLQLLSLLSTAIDALMLSAAAYCLGKSTKHTQSHIQWHSIDLVDKLADQAPNWQPARKRKRPKQVGPTLELPHERRH